MKKWLHNNWKRVLGGALVVAPFAGLIAADVAERGFLVAVITWGISITFAASFCVGVWLLNNGGRSC